MNRKIAILGAAGLLTIARVGIAQTTGTGGTRGTTQTGTTTGSGGADGGYQAVGERG